MPHKTYGDSDIYGAARIAFGQCGCIPDFEIVSPAEMAKRKAVFRERCEAEERMMGNDQLMESEVSP